MDVKKVMVALLLLQVITIPVFADIAFYGGTEFLMGDITLTFQSGVTVRYFEFDPSTKYFILDELRMDITNTATLAINISEVNSAKGLSKDDTVMRFNATATTGTASFTFTGNFTNAIYDIYVDSVLAVNDEQTNADGAISFSRSSWSAHDYDIRLVSYIPDPPYNGSSIYHTTGSYANRLNISWERGNYSDRDVVLRKVGSYPESSTDGTVIQNGTTVYYNNTVWQSGFYTVFSYNVTTSHFSETGLDIPWGAVGITIYNESEPWTAISPFGLLVTDAEGVDTYYNSTCTTTHYIDILDIPYGENTVFVLNATGYKDRKYYEDLETNYFYNYTWYLPPQSTIVDPGSGDDGGNNTQTRSYYLRVIDELGGPIADAKIIVRRYVNETEQFQTVGSQICDGNGEASFNLVPNELYKLNITADNYKTGYFEYTPDPDYYGIYYPKTFQLEFEEIEPQAPELIIEEIEIEAEREGTTLYVNFTDNMESMENIQIYIYEINKTTGNQTLIQTYSESTGLNTHALSYTVNSSNDHIIQIYYNHTYWGFQSDVRVVPGIRTPAGGGNADAYISALIGSHPMGWANFLIFVFLLAAMHYADQRDASKILILLGGLFLFFNIVVGFETTLMTVAGGVLPSLFVVIGLMGIWSDSKKKGAT